VSGDTDIACGSEQLMQPGSPRRMRSEAEMPQVVLGPARKSPYDIHDGQRYTTLQSEAGYIVARSESRDVARLCRSDICFGGPFRLAVRE
jgi:hypothetical protein